METLKTELRVENPRESEQWLARTSAVYETERTTLMTELSDPHVGITKTVTISGFELAVPDITGTNKMLTSLVKEVEVERGG